MTEQELNKKLRRSIGTFDTDLIISIASDCQKVAQDYANYKVEELEENIKACHKKIAELVIKSHELKKQFEEEKKSVWDRACEAQKESIMDFYSYHFPIDSDQISRTPKPEYKP
jgi:uncharacterized coiled-coil DUF342 family protein